VIVIIRPVKDRLDPLCLPKSRNHFLVAGLKRGKSKNALQVRIPFAVSFQGLQKIPHWGVIGLIADQHNRIGPHDVIYISKRPARAQVGIAKLGARQDEIGLNEREFGTVVL